MKQNLPWERELNHTVELPRLYSGFLSFMNYSFIFGNDKMLWLAGMSIFIKLAVCIFWVKWQKSDSFIIFIVLNMQLWKPEHKTFLQINGTLLQIWGLGQLSIISPLMMGTVKSLKQWRTARHNKKFWDHVNCKIRSWSFLVATWLGEYVIFLNCCLLMGHEVGKRGGGAFQENTQPIHTP
jgi:hypothetical protein